MLFSKELLYSRCFMSRSTKNSVEHVYKTCYVCSISSVFAKMLVCHCQSVLTARQKALSVHPPHLSLQHVSSLDACWPLLCAVGAPDRQAVSLALLLGVTGS